MRKIITVAAVIIAAFVLPGATAMAQGNLATLKNAFISEKNSMELEISKRYLNQLIILRNQAAATGNSGDLTAVTAEISRIRTGITALGGAAVAPPAPTVKALTSRHIARDYIKVIKGWAGIPEFSRNNIYSFNIPETGKVSTLKFYASGRDSTDTYGEVFLTTPEGRTSRIYKWSPDDFEIPIKEARIYKHLKAVRVDISKFVREPGTYRVKFKYRKGDDPLGILRVEINS